jgi:hypothetical protein
MVNATSQLLYPRERDPVPFVLEAGWASGPVWKSAEIRCCKVFFARKVTAVWRLSLEVPEWRCRVDFCRPADSCCRLRVSRWACCSCLSILSWKLLHVETRAMTCNHYIHRSTEAKGKAIPVEASTGFQEVKAAIFQDSRHMEVVRLSALRTGRLYPQEIPVSTHFC